MSAPRLRALAAALALSHAYRWGAAALLALPVVGVVSASGVRGFPGGDARLFEPGGLYLVELAVRARELLLESLTPTALAALMLALAGVLPQWLLLQALGPSESRPARALPRLGALLLTTWLLRALLALITLAAAGAARAYFAGSSDERAPTLAAASVVSLGLLPQAALSIVHDLAATALVAHDETLLDALAAAIARPPAAFARLGLRYAAAALLALACLLGASAAAGALNVHLGEAWRTLGATAVHQLGVFASIVARAAWLWSARRALSERDPGRAQAEAFL